MASNIFDLVRAEGIRLRKLDLGDHRTTCPQCSAQRRKKSDVCLSVTVQPGRAVWNCHHCGWTGWTSVAKAAASRPKVEYARPTFRPVDPQASVLEWFAKRGISADVVRRNGVCAVKRRMPHADEPVTAIAFPFRRQGEVVNVKYRTLDKRFAQEKGAEKIYFGLDDIVGADQIVVVEGEIDKLSVEEAGLLECVSIPDGAFREVTADLPTDEDKKWGFVASGFEHFEAARRIILACDADEPGAALTEELLRRYGRDKCWLVEWPEGVKDANDMLIKRGRDALLRAIEQARPAPTDGEVHVTGIWAQVEAAHRMERPPSFSLGWPEYDDVMRLGRRQITVVTGRPGNGKSSWLDQVFVNLAQTYDWRFGIFSAETEPVDHVINLLEKVGRVPFYDGPRPRLTTAEAESMRPWLDEHFRFIVSPTPCPTIDWLLDRARYMVRRYGIDALLIDPYNQISPDWTEGQGSETQFILSMLNKIRHFVKETNTHCFIVAHPSKQARAPGGRKVPIGLDSIGGSSHWEAVADLGVVVGRVNRDEDGNAIPIDRQPTEVAVEKVRKRHFGRADTKMRFRFDRVTGCFGVWRDTEVEGG